MRHPLKKREKAKKGTALVLTMIFVLVFSIVVAGVLTNVQQETRQTHRARAVGNAMEGAKATLRILANNVTNIARTRPPQLGGNLDSINPIIHSITPDTVPGIEFVTNSSGEPLTYVKDRGPNDTIEYREITDPSDPWYQYTTSRLDYEIISFVRDTNNNSDTLGVDGMGVKTRLKIDYIPLYQYAIFYEGDMELFPGPVMDVRGKTHSNSDMYLAGNSGMFYHAPVTSAGNIYRYTRPAGLSDPSGDVNVISPTGGTTREGKKFAGMIGDNNPADSDNYLTHKDVNWYDESLKKWGGNVKDSAHGVGYIRPPLPPGFSSRQLLERASSADSVEAENTKFEYQADMIIAGDPGNTASIKAYKVTLNGDGSRNIVQLASIPSFGGTSVVSIGEFYDGQQNTVVRTIDINMNILRQQTVVNFVEGRGVLYVTTKPGETIPGTADAFVLNADNTDPVIKFTAAGDIQFDSKGIPVTDAGQAGWVATGTALPASFVEGGTVQAGRNTYMPAVRIINGAQIPRNASNAFAFYTDRPLYVAGNFNTANKATAVIGGDSFTATAYTTQLAITDSNDADRIPDLNAAGNPIMNGFTRAMGNDWTASAYSWSGTARNKAVNTTQNAIVLLGNTPSEYPVAGNRPNVVGTGGVHNTIRYLEDWGGATHTFSGSIICLYSSGIAVRRFRDSSDVVGVSGSKVYRTPPNRNYNWDSSLRAAVPPPGIPLVIEISTAPVEIVNLEYALANR